METLQEKFERSPYKRYLIGIFFFLIIFVLIAVYRNRDIVFEKKILSKSEFIFPDKNKNEKWVINETGKMKSSQNSDWWLNSGGIMNVEKNEFSTNLGKLPEDSAWRKLYKENNSRDTDDGYYPQNIFRLVSKSQWKNFTQSMYFYIDTNNLSESEYRNESNGVLFFNRYADGDNLYYAGLRVDGDVVIKKKIAGKYYTLAEKGVLPKDKKYDRVKNPNLIPLKKWMGIKSELSNFGNDTTVIKLYLDLEGNGNWQLVLETKDSGSKYGKAPFLNEGYAGIRTDFMDVKFREYKIVGE